MNRNLAVLRNSKNAGGYGKNLANLMDAMVVTAGYRPLTKPRKWVVNYGVGRLPVWYDEAVDRGVRFINEPLSVANSVNKITTLGLLSENNIACLYYSTNYEEAVEMLKHGRVFCRTTVTASRGRGIVIAETASSLVESPLYTSEFPKNKEYRIHVFNGKVIDRVEKRRRTTAKLEELGLKYNPDVRNLDNGSVFCRKNLLIFPEIDTMSIDAVKVLGLNFGAVDVLADVDEDGLLISAAVCEVNTAPALQSPTMEAYLTSISEYTGEEYELQVSD